MNLMLTIGDKGLINVMSKRQALIHDKNFEKVFSKHRLNLTMQQLESMSNIYK